jgi:hypothetical protein
VNAYLENASAAVTEMGGPWPENSADASPSSFNMLLIWISGLSERNSGAKTVKLLIPFWHRREFY